MAEPKAKTEPKAEQLQPWFRIVTRRIGPVSVGGIPSAGAVEADLCGKFLEDEWELKSTHFMGMEPNAIEMLFVFVRR